MSRSGVLILILLAVATVQPAAAAPPSAFSDYDAMRARMGVLYNEGDYSGARDLLAAHLDVFPGHLASNAFNLAHMHIMLGEYREACGALAHAIDSGIWYGRYSIQAAAFAPLFELAAFEELLARNDALRGAATSGEVRIDVVPPRGYDPERSYPLMLALHGSDGDNMEFRAAWHSETLAWDFVTAYVQSSVPSGMRGFSWFAPDEIRADIMTAYRRIEADYAIDPRQVYVGGYSAGAIATFCMAFDSDLPLRGYLCLGPPVPLEILTEENIERAVERGLRGAAIIGEHDPFLPGLKTMAATFDSLGHDFSLWVVPDLGHSYPADLPLRIDEALTDIVH